MNHLTPEEAEAEARKDIERRWCVLCCGVRAEKKAADKLGEMGFRVYHPTLVEERKHRFSTKTIETIRPLFPRYLFVREFPLEDHLSWYLIRKTEGIQAVLLINGAPAKVPGEVVQELRDAQTQGLWDSRFAKRGTIKAGQRVRIVEGAFAGQMAIVKACVSDKTAKVLMTIFGGERQARVPIDAIRAVA
jgi:transcriptional antiterminator RfaH